MLGQELLVKISQGLRWRKEAIKARLIVELAAAYRYLALRHVSFIGVTGSCGKSTAKELIFAVLETRSKVFKSAGNENTLNQISQVILRVRPSHAFHIQEIGIGGDHPIERSVDLVKPEIGVVTNIGSDHISQFGSKEAIANEKAKMLSALPTHGTAVLNADDAHVVSMKRYCDCRVITFGLSSDAMLRADEVRSNWPDCLTFTVSYDGQSAVVRSQLLGEHWVHVVLAAIAVGLASGISLAEAAEAVQSVPAFEGRMSPVEHPDGVTFIRDDIKAPLWTVRPGLEFLRNAEAKRKILVLGTLSDYRGRSRPKYVGVAKDALEIADYVFFVGPRSMSGLGVKRGTNDERIRAYSEAEPLAVFLKSFLRAGDLVLLKGTNRLDHLLDIVEACVKAPLEPHCSLESEENSAPIVNGSTEPYGAQPFKTTCGHAPGSALAIVGIGNVGEKFQATRHNIGQRVLDLLVDSLGGEWSKQDQALLARIEWKGETVYLIKTLTNVNHTGEALQKIVDQACLRPTECMLIYDDTSFAVGATKTRRKGGDGGHKGVLSILEAFQTTEFPRIKIGIGKPERVGEMMEHFLGEFTATERPLIDQACAEAAEKALEWVAKSPRQRSS